MNGCMKYISLIARCAVQSHDERLSPYGLRGNQGGYIVQVCADPGLSQDRLAQRLHVNRSNVTRQLAELEKRGFVTRRRSTDDARVLAVHPTPKALDALGFVRAIHRDYSDYLTSDFTDTEREQFIAFLSRAAAKAEARAAAKRQGEPR